MGRTCISRFAKVDGPSIRCLYLVGRRRGINELSDEYEYEHDYEYEIPPG